MRKEQLKKNVCTWYLADNSPKAVCRMNLLLITLLLLFLLVTVTLWKKKSLDIHDFNLQRMLPLRAILALLIVIHHISFVLKEQHLSIISEFGVWGCEVVGVFFFITGYGLMVSFRRKGESYLHGFLAHRMRKLLPPFLLAMFGWLAFLTVRTGNNAFLSLAVLAEGGTPLPNAWFVFAIVLFYLSFFAAARLTSNPYRINLILWGCTTIYIIGMIQLGWGSWWYNSVYALNVGFTYACVEPQIKLWLQRKPWLLIVSLFGIGLILYATIKVLGCQPDLPPVCYNLINSLVPLFVVLTIYALGMVKNRVLDFLGRISYEIYLVHGCCILYLWGHSERWWLFISIIYAVSIFSAWLLHLLCKGLSKLSDGYCTNS